jgi:hypothetical protein
MTKNSDVMQKFEFLLGEWDMEYHIPKSAFSASDTGSGSGIFKRALDDKYVYFDYTCQFPSGSGAAHAVFVWDDKIKMYRYWWFENSGSFMTATCNFVNEDTLFLNWHNSLLIQTFKKADKNKVILRMEHPIAEGEFELVLEVIFTRK